MTEVQYRTGCISSDTEIEGLFEGLERGRRPPQTSRIFSQAEQIVTAHSGPRLVGVVYGSSSGSVVNLAWIYVHTSFRKHGIGRNLVKELLGNYRSSKQVKLVTHQEASSFFQAIGFRIRTEAIPMIADISHVISGPDDSAKPHPRGAGSADGSSRSRK
jgi:ribosomal protein S18 acetylase RimI-like enzyme